MANIDVDVEGGVLLGGAFPLVEDVIGLEANPIAIVDDTGHQLERRRHRKKQRLNRKRRARASRFMQQTRRG